jgi:hypothetical protein
LRLPGQGRGVVSGGALNLDWDTAELQWRIR